MLKILIADQDPIVRHKLKSALARQHYEVHEADDGHQALALNEEYGVFGIALIDINLPSLNGFELMQRLKDTAPQISCILLVSTTRIEDAIAAVKAGASDYLEKPTDDLTLSRILKSVAQASNVSEQDVPNSPQLSFDIGRNIIGESDAIQRVFDIIYKLAKVDTSVLIRGESGTGKELVAQALHYNSSRKKGPFVAVNCGAIPENLIESELFGHEKGSFTGADRRKIGKFQFASGGTIFLDEIGDISAQMQVKLLRILQEKKFTPVGGNQEIQANVRIISATNRNLEEMIKKNEFREDLFYRLNVLPINLPRLRDRREDIPGICRYMIQKFNKIHSRKITGIEPEAMDAMRAYSWPGNIRELENVVEHAFIIESSDSLHLESLPQHIQSCGPMAYLIPSSEVNKVPASARQTNGIITDFSELKYPVLKERFEREFIVRALRAYKGRINQTAEETLMTKVTLLRKLEKYGINPKEFR